MLLISRSTCKNWPRSDATICDHKTVYMDQTPNTKISSIASRISH